MAQHDGGLEDSHQMNGKEEMSTLPRGVGKEGRKSFSMNDLAWCEEQGNYSLVVDTT
jgi:hypothetical protein